MFFEIENLQEQFSVLDISFYGALIIGVLFGAIGEKSKYCVRAAVAEFAMPQQERAKLANKGLRARQFLSAIFIALIGTQILHFSGLIDLSNSLYWSTPIASLALILGGLLFGAGMILAGGCASRLVVLSATGNMRSLTTIIFIAISGYATMRGILALPRLQISEAWTLNLTFADYFAQNPYSHLAFAIILALGILSLLVRQFHQNGYSGILAGVGIGSLIIAGWWVSGVLAYDEFEPLPLASLSAVAPLGNSLQHMLIFTGSEANFGIGFIGGILIGAFISAIIGKRFKYQGFQSEKAILRHAVAGIMMGFGAVLALGCTLGQGHSGISTAAPSSVLVLGAIFAGGYVTAKYFYGHKAFPIYALPGWLQSALYYKGAAPRSEIHSQ